MGWKNIKEHYQIEHIVHVSEEGICIGSGYITDLIVVGQDGALKKRFNERSNADLLRYQSEMDADPELLKRLVQSQDSFVQSIPVYTYEDGSILEKFCEEPGWPNATHDGCLMYENTFSTDKDQVVAWAKRNAEAHVNSMRRIITQNENDLAEFRAELAGAEENRTRLESDYPATETA